MSLKSAIATMLLSMRRWRRCLTKNAEQIRQALSLAERAFHNSGKVKSLASRVTLSRSEAFLRLWRSTTERSDVCAMRDEALGSRSRRRQLDGERNFALVAQDAELHGLVFVLGIALCRKLLAKVADGANAFAVDGSDHIAGLESTLFGGRTRVHFAH